MGFYKHLYESEEYRNFRWRMFKRDGFKCRVCGSKGSLELHHIELKSLNPEKVMEARNVISLCPTHHLMVTKNENKYSEQLIEVLKGLRTDLED